MELSKELKADLGKRAVEIYSSVRFGALPKEAWLRDPDVFLKDEFNQAWKEYLDKNVPAPKSEEAPVKKTKKKA